MKYESKVVLYARVIIKYVLQHMNLLYATLKTAVNKGDTELL